MFGLILAIKQNHFMLSLVNQSWARTRIATWKSAGCHSNVRKM